MKKSTAIMFIIPALLFYSMFIVTPMLSSVAYSLTSWDGISPTMNFIGLDNYQNLLTNARFLNALKNTLIIAVSLTLGWNILSLLLAMIVDNLGKSSNVFRAIFYLPVLVSGIVTGFIWSILYNYNFGVINSFLVRLGLAAYQQDWLGNPQFTVPGIILTILWNTSGYYMVIYLAALQSVPQELVEAAKIDGSGPIMRFRHITIPMIAGAITVNMSLGMIHAMRVFDHIAVMTDGGPGFTSETITYIIYRVAFGEGRQGYGTAMAIVLFLFILLVTLIQNTILRKREVQL